MKHLLVMYRNAEGKMRVNRYAFGTAGGGRRIFPARPDAGGR